MKISGLQKLTLLDYPEKVACTIFSGGCNFRCPFCHNASLVLPELIETEIPVDEIFSFLRKRQGIIDGVCLTGGEPLMQTDTYEFLSQIKSMGYLVKLDTNGSFPERLIELVNSGVVDYVAMDIKNSEEKYPETCGINNLMFSKIRKSIDFLLSEKVDYEFRTTVVKELHDEKSFKDIALLIKGAKKYFLQSYRESENMIKSGYSAYESKELNYFADIVRQHVKNVLLRGI